MTVTKNPHKTSFGAVSIQLRTTAETINVDLDKMSEAERRTLIRNLQIDAFNLDVVAKHLRLDPS